MREIVPQCSRSLSSVDDAGAAIMVGRLLVDDSARGFVCRRDERSRDALAGPPDGDSSEAVHRTGAEMEDVYDRGRGGVTIADPLG